MSHKKIWALLTAALLFASTAAMAAQTKAPSKAAPSKEGGKSTAEKPKEHQATGTVVSFSKTSLVISKTRPKGEWTFTLTPKTKTTGTLAKDAKVTVHYHEEKDQKTADRINVLEAKPESKPPAKSKSSKSKPQP